MSKKEKIIKPDMEFDELIKRVAQTENKEVIQISKENMKDETIDDLLKDFEGKVQQDKNGVEFWHARDLQVLFQYELWQKFQNVIEKAEHSCEQSNYDVLDHFIQVDKMVEIGSNTSRKIRDYKLTRYACYLIAQNGDPRKKPVAFAQTYFAVQTRRQEIQDVKIRNLTEDEKRVKLRNEIKVYNKSLSSVVKTFGVIKPSDYAIFHNEGYKGLYAGKKKQDIATHKGLKEKDSRPYGKRGVGSKLVQSYTNRSQIEKR
jgi:DNA-damage-inducible protein D